MKISAGIMTSEIINGDFRCVYRRPGSASRHIAGRYTVRKYPIWIACYSEDHLYPIFTYLTCTQSQPPKILSVRAIRLSPGQSLQTTKKRRDIRNCRSIQNSPNTLNIVHQETARLFHDKQKIKVVSKDFSRQLSIASDGHVHNRN